jgi:hypothetical protein
MASRMYGIWGLNEEWWLEYVFNDAITVSDCMSSNGMLVDDELGRILQDALLACYWKVSFWRY